MLALALLSACGGVAAQTPLRRAPLADEPRRPFIPPFAYEAYVRGELLLAAGDPKRAALQFELATAAPEEDAYLLSRLAEAQAQSGERELAARSLAEAERVHPCEEMLWRTRGRWAEADGRLDAASAAYRRAVACAPGSPEARTDLYRVLAAQGQDAESLALLREGAENQGSAALRVALFQALDMQGPAEVRFALDSWTRVGSIDRALIERLARRAVARSERSLALSLRGFANKLEPRLRAQLAVLLGDRDALLSLLAQTHEEALGGPAAAARFALCAHDFERAQAFAGMNDPGASADAMRSLRAQAYAAVGEPSAALEELRQIRDAERRRELSREELARLGLTALAAELSP